MNILDKIIEQKKSYLQKQKNIVELSQLKDSVNYNRNTISLESILVNQRVNIISEFKRRSPSKDNINPEAKVDQIVPLYVEGGASGVSVLTDKEHFKGKIEDLIEARKLINLPILRKDFMIDPYQIHEAKSIGADVILLIAYCLSKGQAEELAGLANQLGLEVLFEIHDLNELEKLPKGTNILGVNNRNLTTFTVDYKYAISVFPDLPKHIVKISESGILSEKAFCESIHAGYKACLIGEYLMKENNPKQTIVNLLNAAIE